MQKTIGLAITSFAFALMVAGCQPPSVTRAEEPSADRLTVITYNILGGRNTDDSRDLERIVRVIRMLDPDLVALQEVDRGTSRLQGIDLAAELGERLQMEHIFGRAMNFDNGEYGLAILSRFPVRRIERYPLPHGRGGEPRTLLVAFLENRAGMPFFLASTHLDHRRESSDRLAQASHILDILGRFRHLPGILAGDLNTEPNSEVLSILKTRWHDVWDSRPRGETFPSSEPRRRIDYIMVSPVDHWKVVTAFTAKQLKLVDPDWLESLHLASDHVPVAAVLEFKAVPD